MSKFLSLVEENTPGEEQESLADKFHRFADKVSALEGGRGDVDELLLELNGLNEELTTLGGVPEVDGEEDFEVVDNYRKKKMDRFKQNAGNISSTLATAAELRAADPDPKRPSRGVQKINKEVDKLGKAVAKGISRVTKLIK